MAVAGISIFYLRKKCDVGATFSWFVLFRRSKRMNEGLMDEAG